MVHGEVDIPIKVGTEIFNSTFYVMDISPSYSCLLGRPWIHHVGVVTLTLHQMLKYPVQGKIITVHGKKKYMISHLNSFLYGELDGEFIETPFQHFEEVAQEICGNQNSGFYTHDYQTSAPDVISQGCKSNG